MDTSISYLADNIVIAMSYHPGFQTDPISWTLTIDDTGRLTQSLNTIVPLPKRTRRAIVQIDQTSVLEWIIQVEALNFCILQTLEGSMIIDDASTYSVICKFTSVQRAITLHTLVVRHYDFEGYRRRSFLRAVSVVKRHLTVPLAAFRSRSQTAISSATRCLLAKRRSRH